MRIEEQILNLQSKKEDFFQNPEKPVYNLKDCLKKTKQEVLLSIYDNYRLIIKSTENLPELSKKADLEDFLLKNLPNYFKEYTIFYSFPEKLEKFIKTTKTTTPNLIFLAIGFMFAFQEKGQDIYICPKEFTNIYKEVTTLNSDLAYEKLCIFFEQSVFIYGFVSKEIIENIIRRNHICVDAKLVAKYVEEHNLYIYKDNYYLPVKPDETSIIDEAIAFKEQMAPKYLELPDQSEYFCLLSSYEQELADCLKIDATEIEARIVALVLQPEEPEHLQKYLSTIKKIDNKTKTKLTTIINKYKHDIRYWLYNGRTEDEYYQDTIFQKMLLKTKPKTTSLKDCLEVLTEEGLAEIIDTYNCDKDKLAANIQENFNEFVYFYNREFIESIIKNQDIDYENNIEYEDLTDGFFYIYQDKTKIKYIIPKEIKSIMKKIDLNDLINYEIEDDTDSDIIDYIECYLNINGLIEKKKLIELLKENHNLEITEENLTTIIKEMDYSILHEKYYCVIKEMNDEDVEKLMTIKNNFGNYKKADIVTNIKDQQYEDELEEFILNEFAFPEKKIEEIMGSCLFLIKMGFFSQDVLEATLASVNITLKQSELHKLTNFIKRFKNEISVWQYNGYTLNEVNNFKNPKKIGRNEPCPCGSGKKYKKCCGK